VGELSAQLALRDLKLLGDAGDDLERGAIGLSLLSLLAALLALTSLSTRPQPARFAALTRHSPDVVLLDLAMPGDLRGEAIITRISRGAPVIVISGIDNAEVARDALESGAFDFMMKPLTLSRVRQVVEAAIAKGGGSATRS